MDAHTDTALVRLSFWELGRTRRVPGRPPRTGSPAHSCAQQLWVWHPHRTQTLERHTSLVTSRHINATTVIPSRDRRTKHTHVF
jgi:hypothetical protein